MLPLTGDKPDAKENGYDGWSPNYKIAGLCLFRKSSSKYLDTIIF